MNILEGTPEQMRKLINYPAVVDFRVIIKNGIDDALNQVRDAINAVEHDGAMPLQGAPRPSRTGKYLSYTQSARVTSYENLHAIYNKVGALACVMHIL